LDPAGGGGEPAARPRRPSCLGRPVGPDVDAVGGGVGAVGTQRLVALVHVGELELAPADVGGGGGPQAVEHHALGVGASFDVLGLGRCGAGGDVGGDCGGDRGGEREEE